MAAFREKPFRIILAEDTRTYREYLKHLLHKELGHRVVYECSTGKELIEGVKKIQNPDLVITDVVMPDMDGIQAAREIAQLNPDLPIYLITGVEDTARLIKAFMEVPQIVDCFLKREGNWPDKDQLQLTLLARVSHFTVQREAIKRLEERQLSERAKWLLLRQSEDKYGYEGRWNEETAWQALRQTAQKESTSVAKLARDVIDGKRDISSVQP